jgi:hypothetical protein
LGQTINEELDDDIRIPEVDESPYPSIHEGCTSEDPTNKSLAATMEQEIARVVGEWRAGIHVFPTTSNEPSMVAEMEHDSAQYLAERERRPALFAKNNHVFGCLIMKACTLGTSWSIATYLGGVSQQQTLDEKNYIARWQSP